MSRITYLRVATLLPVLFPTVLTAVLYLTNLLDTMIGAAVLILFDAALVFGLPYLAFAALALMLLANAAERTYVRVGLAAPFIFAVVVSAMLVFRSSVSGVDFRSLAFLAGVSVMVGYLYVAIAFAGLFLFKELGVIREAVARP